MALTAQVNCVHDLLKELPHAQRTCMSSFESVFAKLQQFVADFAFACAQRDFAGLANDEERLWAIAQHVEFCKMFREICFEKHRLEPSFAISSATYTFFGAALSHIACILERGAKHQTLPETLPLFTSQIRLQRYASHLINQIGAFATQSNLSPSLEIRWNHVVYVVQKHQTYFRAYLEEQKLFQRPQIHFSSAHEITILALIRIFAPADPRESN